MPMWPRWANDHDVAHLQAKTVPMNFIWSELAQWMLRSGVRKVFRALITPVGIANWLHCVHDTSHVQAKTVPMNLIWSESAQWLLSYSVCKVWAGQTDRDNFISPPFSFRWVREITSAKSRVWTTVKLRMHARPDSVRVCVLLRLPITLRCCYIQRQDAAFWGGVNISVRDFSASHLYWDALTSWIMSMPSFLPPFSW